MDILVLCVCGIYYKINETIYFDTVRWRWENVDASSKTFLEWGNKKFCYTYIFRNDVN